jgi:N-acetylmuramoyl-L-alanine amidase
MYSVREQKQVNRAGKTVIRRVVSFGVILWLMLGIAAQTQQFQALARLEGGQSRITGRASGDVDIALKLTQAVPYRVFTLGDPARLVMDFREVNFDGARADRLIRTELITQMRYGIFRPGWSRMVLEMKRPMRVHQVAMQTDPEDGDALIRIRLTPQDPDAFAAETGPVDDDFWALPETPDAPLAKTRPLGDRKTVVALDPGHGGIDPGAQYQGYDEADLMLMLAREMKEKLILSGRYEVFLTRDEDVFLSLQGRVSAARARGADLFISLHADALAAGRASGTTVYTLSETASDSSAEALAESHERSDLLAGVDLQEQDDLIAAVLMDMARIETMPRSEKLADALVAGIADSVGRIRSRPRLSAGFSVLKAPDIPSVLIEFGFMSNPNDLANLANPDWRAKVISGILDALDKWGLEDAAEARLLRQ